MAKAGNKVALVERGKLGGVCVNTGCTPTKTMVASARPAYPARRGAEYGVRVGPVSVDMAAVRERKRAVVAGARQNYQPGAHAQRHRGGRVAAGRDAAAVCVHTRAALVS